MSVPPSSTAPPRKRRRPALSCEQCRRRKIKCDRTYPCGQCTQSATASCSYSPDTVRKPHRVSDRVTLPAKATIGIPHRARSPRDSSSTHTTLDGASPNALSHSDTTLPSSWTSPSVGPPDGIDDVGIGGPNTLLARIMNTETESTITDQSFPYLCEDFRPNPQAKQLRGTVTKTRFFGPSHWMYSYGIVKFTSRYRTTSTD
jgi:hypothetical protein